MDADLTSRARLWEPHPNTAARVRGFDDLARAATRVWVGIPAAAPDPDQTRIVRIARALHPQPHPHRLALTRHVNDLRHRIETGTRIPTGDSLPQARHTMTRIRIIERHAADYLQPRWPTTVTGQHPSRLDHDRLPQALAAWDLHAHRALAARPATPNLEWVARIQQGIAHTTALITTAAAHQAHPDPNGLHRAVPALTGLAHTWGALGGELARLHGRRRDIDPALLRAGREANAAMREITHHHTSYAAPDVTAARVPLDITTAYLHERLTATLELALITRDTLQDPGLTVSARAAHTITAGRAAPPGLGMWVDAASLHHNRDIPLPPPVKHALTRHVEDIITAAVTADSATTSHRPLRTPQQAPATSTIRTHPDRTPPRTPVPAPATWGCER